MTTIYSSCVGALNPWFYVIAAFLFLTHLPGILKDTSCPKECNEQGDVLAISNQIQAVVCLKHRFLRGRDLALCSVLHHYNVWALKAGPILGCNPYLWLRSFAHWKRPCQKDWHTVLYHLFCYFTHLQTIGDWYILCLGWSQWFPSILHHPTVQPSHTSLSLVFRKPPALMVQVVSWWSTAPSSTASRVRLSSASSRSAGGVLLP